MSTTTSRLDPLNLIDIIKGEIMFIRIPNFMSQEVCQFVSEKILHGYKVEEAATKTGLTYSELLKANKQQTHSSKQYFNEVGMSYFETTFDSTIGWNKIPSKEKKSNYYENATESIELTRTLFSPYLSPIDKLRLELDDRWPLGSIRLNLNDGKMFCGLLRVLSGEVLAHDDKLERDHGPLPDHLNYLGQFATNTYLKVPEKGGELLLWNISLDDKEYDRMRGDSYGISFDKLGSPAAVVTPQEGDLIIFNSRKLHGINKSYGSERISVSSFMAYGGENKPLFLWS